MNKALYWLWLQSVLGPCNAKFLPLLEIFGSAEAIYQKRETAQLIQYLSPGEIRHARELELEPLAQAVEQCADSEIHMLCYPDEAYPERLRKTKIPPMVLFVTGSLAALSTPFSIAGVGARFSTQYGREAVRHICEPLAKAGICLVSGMAYGIDAEVHKAALRHHAPTVAVLGTPIDVTYPANHKALRDDIERNGGAVVSEYLPGTVIGKQMFSQRNRIISGLAQGVVIFEAAKKSGTMITATWALDDGRDVFAVPGSILSPHSEGTNYLIKNGAASALSALDILEALDLRDVACEHIALDSAHKSPLSKTQTVIYAALEEGACSADALAQRTELALHVLLAELTAMEMDGVIQPVGGSRYAIK